MRATKPDPTALEELLVSELMRPGVLSCTRETPLREVARMMTEHRIHCVIVVGRPAWTNATGLVWGVLSDLDLTRAAVAGGDVTAGEAAATEVVTASPTDTLADAGRLMAEHDTSHLVVVDDTTGEPMGILSTLDLAAAVAGRAP